MGQLAISDKPETILNLDGTAVYFGSVLDEQSSKLLFDKLEKEIDWQRDKVMMFGKVLETTRLVSWYGKQKFTYKYSNKEKVALPYPKVLEDIHSMVENITGQEYNSCLLNFYHDGSQSMSWHSDNEREIEGDSSICSLSLGARRKFKFKHIKTGQVIDVWLENGSVIDMSGEIQRFWKHCLPKTKKVTAPRINLTFRKMKEK
jgi:alkylated DNA repair dioxygenase AlkB